MEQRHHKRIRDGQRVRAVPCFGVSQFPAIQLAALAWLAAGEITTDEFSTSADTAGIYMPHRSSRGLPRSAQGILLPRVPCDKSATGSQERLRTRQSLRVGTWNIRTMLFPGSARVLAQELTRAKINIMALQEVSTAWCRRNSRRWLPLFMVWLSWWPILPCGRCRACT